MEYQNIREYLLHMINNGKTLSFSLLEKKFKIKSSKYLGDRAKYIWYSFQDSGLNVDEYIEKLKNKKRNRSHPFKSDNVTEKRNWTQTQDDFATFDGITTRKITNLEEAIEFANIDLDTWSIESWGWKSWNTTIKNADGHPETVTNYAVSIKLRARKESFAEIANDVIDEIRTWEFPIINNQYKNTTDLVGVISLSDFHFGAKVEDLLETFDYNLNIIKEKLNQCVSIVNSRNYKEVHLNLLGDFYESLSGLNHLNTFKSLERKGHGANIIKITSGILSKFISSINNVKEVNIVPGNHDRLTPKSDVDNMGEGGEILSYILELLLPKININYHPYCLSKTIDDIHYILTHGHHKMNNKETAFIVQKYGKNELYNVLLEGHLHTRRSTKYWSKRPMLVDNQLIVGHDEAKYRKIVVPSIFTGNYYSETLGYTSSSGVIIIENNGNGHPNVFDYTL